MKKSLTLLLVCCAFAALSAKELKVLMIGNSFSASVHAFLPKMVEAGKTHKLKLANAFIGGCTIERHCKNIDAEKTKPNAKPYTFVITGEAPRKEKLSVMIKSDKWDIITIQQGSRHSPYKDKTQEPGKKLIAFVKSLAPQAEIIVHQTWAYRADHDWFTGATPKMTRQKMHEMLTENYNELAKSNNFRMIPVGNAVQLFREKLPVKEVKYTKEDLAKLKYPKLIDISGGDVVGRTAWNKEKVLRHDRIHLNAKGQYLQACVWYMFLFDAKASDIKLEFKDKNAKLLVECAEAAVKAARK